MHRLAVVVVWRSIMTHGDHVITNHICQDYSGAEVAYAYRYGTLESSADQPVSDGEQVP